MPSDVHPQATPGDEQDDEACAPLKLNPTLSLAFSFGLRLPNRPYTRFRMDLREDLELARFLVAALAQGVASNQDFELDASEEVLESAIRRGLIVSDETDPGEATRFRCSLDDSQLRHVRDEEQRAADALVANSCDLVLNAACVLQPCNALPSSLEGLVQVEGLKDPGIEERNPSLDGLPVGLPPLGPLNARLWVAHPDTGVWQPYEVREALLPVLRSLLAGEVAPCDLPRSLLRTLILGHVVLPPSEPVAIGDEHSRFADFRSRLARDGHLVLRNVVSPLWLGALKSHYLGLEQTGFLETDETQVKGKRDGVYCEFITLFLQDQLGRFLNRFLSEPIKPSYTWFFRYRSGAVLERHKDRPQCRWNVSFAVDSFPDRGQAGAWPLWFRVDLEERSVLLGSGDAVIYSGTDVEHWRDQLPDERTASMCFLHYVNADFKGHLG